LCEKAQSGESAALSWSSSSQEKALNDNEFAGCLDFNQHTEGEIAPARAA